MDLRKTFDGGVEGYDRFRPRYCSALFSDIIAFSGLNENSRALEIGIGAGQATLPFLKTGCSLTAVELGENMAEYSRQKFSEHHNINIINSSFEGYRSDLRFDLVYSATAFHWIKPEIGYPKVFDMLKKGGTLALFWNRPFAARKDNPMHVEMQKIYSKYRPGNAKPEQHGEKDRLKILDAIKSFGFRNVELRLYYGQRAFNADDYIGLLNTYSDHIAMPPDIKGAFEKEIAEIINKLGGIMDITDTMDLYLAKRP